MFEVVDLVLNTVKRKYFVKNLGGIRVGFVTGSGSEKDQDPNRTEKEDLEF